MNIYFTIETIKEDKKEEIDFQIEMSGEGVIGGYSFNPVSGWTNYSDFTVSWSEQDEELNELLRAIKDFSQSMELDYLLYDVTEEDIGKSYKMDYYCDGYVHENKTYSFNVIITDVFMEEE